MGRSRATIAPARKSCWIVKKVSVLRLSTLERRSLKAQYRIRLNMESPRPLVGRGVPPLAPKPVKWNHAQKPTPGGNGGTPPRRLTAHFAGGAFRRSHPARGGRLASSPRRSAISPSAAVRRGKRPMAAVRVRSSPNSSAASPLASRSGGRRLILLRHMISNASRAASFDASPRKRGSSLRAKRSYPAPWGGSWIALSLRSSQ